MGEKRHAFAINWRVKSGDVAWHSAGKWPLSVRKEGRGRRGEHIKREDLLTSKRRGGEDAGGGSA